MTSFKTGTVIFCDDVRMEMGGKESLLGVYKSVMVTEKVPLTLPKLCVRIPIYGPNFAESHFTFEVVGPDKKQLIEAKGELNIRNSDSGYENIFGIALRQIVLPSYGEYEVWFLLGSGKPKKVAKLLVREARPGDPTYVEPDSHAKTGGGRKRKSETSAKRNRKPRVG